MNRVLSAGLERGRIELVHLARNPRESVWQILGPALVLIGITQLIDGAVQDTPVPMADLLVAGFISMAVFQTGLITLPQILVTEREEGTLLRLRATPGGLQAYLVSKVVVIAAMATLSTLVILLAGAVVVGTPLPGSVGDWLTLAWVLALGFVAVTTMGACVGALLPNPREALLLIMLVVVALLLVSGIFFPITALPGVLQWVGQVFPLKWMAQGVRSALLPDTLLPAETGQSWQLVQAFGVLSVWSIVGLIFAPRLLRRMTARESGSRLESRREAASQRVA